LISRARIFRTRIPRIRNSRSPNPDSPLDIAFLVQRRTEGDVTHYTLTTLWDSIDAIRRFAGDDYERARYYDEDDDYLLEHEPFVTHGEVLHVAMPA
jgi:hypothetical protein